MIQFIKKTRFKSRTGHVQAFRQKCDENNNNKRNKKKKINGRPLRRWNKTVESSDSSDFPPR